MVSVWRTIKRQWSYLPEHRKKTRIRDFSVVICSKQKCALTKWAFYFTEQALIQHDKLHVVYWITDISHSDKGMFAMCHKHT